MDRKLALWVGMPFVGVAWSLIALVALAPGLVSSRLLMLLLLALSVIGVITLLIRIAVRGRANSALLDALYPMAGILVAIGIGFHGQLAAFTRGAFDYVTQDNPVSDGMHIARADDGWFHVTLTVEGTPVDFMVDVDAPFTLLRPDVPKQIGINPVIAGLQSADRACGWRRRICRGRRAAQGAAGRLDHRERSRQGLRHRPLGSQHTGQAVL
jgi:hypothetical protein